MILTAQPKDTEALPTTGLDDDDNGGLNYGGGDIPAAQGAARSDDGDSGFVSGNNIVGSDCRTPHCVITN